MSARVQQMEQSDPCGTPAGWNWIGRFASPAAAGVEPGLRQRALDDLDASLTALDRLGIRPGAAWQSDWDNYRAAAGADAGGAVAVACTPQDAAAAGEGRCAVRPWPLGMTARPRAYKCSVCCDTRQGC